MRKHFTILNLARKSQIARFLIVVLVLQYVGVVLPFSADAANFTNVSDTLSNPTTSAGSNHVISWTASSTVTAGQTIKFQFDPTSDAFDLSSVVFGDLSASGFTLTAACSGAPSEVTAAFDASAPDENITLTVCATDTIAAGAKSLTIANSHLVNPSSPGSYRVAIAGTQTDSGNAMVAVLDQLTMSADVQTSLTFSVGGLASGQAINGETTSTSTTGTSVGWGLLVPNDPEIAGHELLVTTNAPNGFSVSVREDQNLSSSGGADIDVFANGQGTVAPVVWAAPSGNPLNENTFGHMGVTSNDSDLNGGEFNGSKYAGNFSTTSRVVFANSGPADGLTQDIGKARVAYKIEITALQEAGGDYTNRIFYVCTPTF